MVLKAHCVIHRRQSGDVVNLVLQGCWMWGKNKLNLRMIQNFWMVFWLYFFYICEGPEYLYVLRGKRWVRKDGQRCRKQRGTPWRWSPCRWGSLGSRQAFIGRRFTRQCSWNKCLCKGGEWGGWREKLGSVTAAMKASAKLLGSSDIGAGFQNYPELQCGG